MNESQTYGNVIPRRRGKGGEPIPRRFVCTRPLMTLDPEALLQTTAQFVEGPESARARIPWLKAMNAIAATQNALKVRREMETKMAKETAEAKERITELEPQVKELELRTTELGSELAGLLAGLGLEPSRASLALGPDEPVSLEILAGKHNLPSPESGSWANKVGYRLLAGIGGGIVFGISLGLLTGKLELVSPLEEWPMLALWSGLGTVVMTLVGASLWPLSKNLGGRLYRLGKALPKLHRVLTVLAATFLLGLGLAFIRIESIVERLGLFRAIGEQTSLRGFHVAGADMTWVSLMLVLPTVAAYVVLGLVEGERLANLALLRSLQQGARAELQVSPAYAKACALHHQLQTLTQRKQTLESEIQTQMARIRTDFTEGELHRLEDMDMDAAAASWEAEDALLEPTKPLPPRKRPSLAERFVSSLKRFLGSRTPKSDWQEG